MIYKCKIKELIIMTLIAALLFTSCNPKQIEISSNTEGIKEVINIMTSEDFKGRFSGTEGAYRAALYIEEEYSNLGLDTYFDNSYVQEFEESIFDPAKQKYDFSVKYTDGTVEQFEYGKDYIYRPAVENYKITAPVTYNISDNELKQKIVMVQDYRNMAELMNNSAGVIIRTDNFTQGANVRRNGKPIILLVSKLYDRLIESSIESAAISITSTREAVKGKNIAAIIKGRNSENAVVISAHYDHVGYAGNTIYKGAVDNASGISVLLDIAERLKNQSKNSKFKMDIVICAFDAEEQGLIGSNHFIESIKDKYKNIYDINVDCVGMIDGGKLAIEGDDYINKDMLVELEKYAAKYNIEYTTGELGLTSDHESFIENNICAVNLGQDRVPGIHTAKDTPELIDYDYLTNISNIIYDFIMNNNGRAFVPGGAAEN